MQVSYYTCLKSLIIFRPISFLTNNHGDKSSNEHVEEDNLLDEVSQTDQLCQYQG